LASIPRPLKSVDDLPVPIDTVCSGTQNIGFEGIGKPVFFQKIIAVAWAGLFVKGFPKEWTGCHGLLFRHSSPDGGATGFFEWTGEKIGLRIDPMPAESVPIIQLTAKNDEFSFLCGKRIANKSKITVVQVGVNTQYEVRGKVLGFIQQALGANNTSGSPMKGGVFQKVKIEVMKKGKISLNRVVKGSSPAVELESVFQGAKDPSLPFSFGPP